MVSALAALVALLGALIPTVFYVLFVWWLDRYDKEPVWLLALAFAWGAMPAAFLSVVAELAFDASITLVAGEGLLADLASVSISAPLVEESAKGVALIALALLFRREFHNALDGIVYGAMIGFGFARCLALAGKFGHREHTAAAAAAVVLCAMRFHLNKVHHTVAQDITRLLDDAAVARLVAGIMISHPLGIARGVKFDAPLADVFCLQLHKTDHLERIAVSQPIFGFPTL